MAVLFFWIIAWNVFGVIAVLTFQPAPVVSYLMAVVLTLLGVWVGSWRTNDYCDW